MQIFALVGHSGTGKSHRAPLLAKEYNIDYIIDDGLLIKGNLILAGRSAKRENTRYGAVKRALFSDPDHANQVKDKLAEIKPGKLLILGTSKRMIKFIADNLSLESPVRVYRIEEISDEESIKTAMEIRASENRHVIPLPTFAIKKDFPGYIIDPLRSFFKIPSAHPEGIPVERSVIRPVFSTLGNFFIAEHVVTDLVDYIVTKIPGIHRIIKVGLKNGRNKVTLNIDVEVDIVAIKDKKINVLLLEVQHLIKEEMEYQTGFYLDYVNVAASKLHLDEELLATGDQLRKVLFAYSEETERANLS